MPDERADKVVEAIAAAAKTGQIGDGKIFVIDGRARAAHPHRRDRHRRAVDRSSRRPDLRGDTTMKMPAPRLRAARDRSIARHARRFAEHGAALAAPASKIDAGDTAWMIAATALVLMMTIPGLALFYCRHGAQEERARHHGAEPRGGRLVSLLWALLGYTLAFSGDAPALGNSRSRVPARHRHGHDAARSPRPSPKSCS